MQQIYIHKYILIIDRILRIYLSLMDKLLFKYLPIGYFFSCEMKVSNQIQFNKM